MSYSPTVIANLALGHLGVEKEIANIETENSQEARAMRRFYQIALDEILEEFPWPFAKKTEALALVEEDPTTEWAYAYRYPSDCVKLRRIQSGGRQDSLQSAIEFVVAQDTQGRLIYTDEPEAVMEYTCRGTAEVHYPPGFVSAFSALMAFYTCVKLTGGDPFKIRDSVYAMYRTLLGKAQANALNEQQMPPQLEAEFIRIRE
jgi:hypothetical protein